MVIIKVNYLQNLQSKVELFFHYINLGLFSFEQKIIEFVTRFLCRRKNVFRFIYCQISMQPFSLLSKKTE